MTSHGFAVVAPTRRELAGGTEHAPTAVVGIGEASADATREFLQGIQTRFLLSVGFSGALDPRLRTGDLVVSHQVSFEDSEPLDLASAYFEAFFAFLSRRNRLRVHQGAAITTQHPALLASSKAALREKTGAAVVDMETYWIAVAASEAGVPLISLRTVIDEQHQDLPRFAGEIIADGGHHESKHALLALKNPLNIGPMIALAIRARKATSRTRVALDALLPTVMYAHADIMKAPQ